MLNTEDFYKELFEKYSFDQDKIRLAAIKQAKEPAVKRAVRMYWKPAAGLAAAVAVTVGVTAYAARGIGGGVNITVSPASALSASQRMYEAERSYYNALSEEENIKNIYVTFDYIVSFNDMSLSLSAVTDSDDIHIERLYLEDGSIISGIDEISEFAEKSGSRKYIAAAKLSAPAGLYRSIQDLSSVRLAEFGSDEINDNTFVPIEIDDSDPLMGDRTTETQAVPPVTTTPFSFEKQTSAPAEEQIAVTTEEEDEENEDPDITDTVLPPEETLSPDESDIELVEPDEPDETDSAVSETPAVSAEETTAPTVDIPVTEISGADGQGLMTEIYDLNVPNALETVLIRNYAVVLTKTDVYIYTLGGMIRPNTAQIAELSSPKIAYSDKESLIITGCSADGSRNIIMHINAAEQYMTVTDAASFIGASEIGTISYSSASGKYFIKVIASDKTYIYECVASSETGFAFRPLFESSSAVSLAGSANEKLYYFVQSDGLSSTLREFNCTDGSVRDVAEFASSCKIKRSPTFESFIIIPSDESGTYIFDTSSASIVAAQVDADSQIAVSGGKTYFSRQDKMFAVSSGIISEAYANGISFSNRPESEFFLKSTDTDKVTVVKYDNYNW